MVGCLHRSRYLLTWLSSWGGNSRSSKDAHYIIHPRDTTSTFCVPDRITSWLKMLAVLSRCRQYPVLPTRVCLKTHSAWEYTDNTLRMFFCNFAPSLQANQSLVSVTRGQRSAFLRKRPLQQKPDAKQLSLLQTMLRLRSLLLLTRLLSCGCVNQRCIFYIPL